jgi:hypothetical protein
LEKIVHDPYHLATYMNKAVDQVRRSEHAALFKDNGTLSIQTRLDRHERVLRVLLWVASVMAGTILASWTLGLYSLARHVMVAKGGLP